MPRQRKVNTQSHYQGRKGTSVTNPILYDRWLLFTALTIVALGLLMVTSASMVISDRVYGQPFHYITRQCIYLFMGLLLAFAIVRTKLDFWERYGFIFLFGSLFLLVLVLVPGVGRSVNGSTRWIHLGPIGVQVSEIAKLSMVLFLSGYLVRREDEIRNRVSGFIKPMILLSITAVLLLKEPDFGAAVVIMVTALGLMFLAGVRLWQFVVLLAVVLIALVAIAVSSPYRLLRLTTFMNPWANQFDSGYQLTQSLIAFGRGGWFGVGLGESIQKLFYLPEAHTDFLFAVLAEELGLAGVLSVILLFCVMVFRAFAIGRKAQQQGRGFAAYLAFGFGIWLGIQAMINIGVNSGVLPTKGLTLPLMSYGGSSLIIMCVVVALLLRIDYETRLEEYGLNTTSKRGRRRV